MQIIQFIRKIAVSDPSFASVVLLLGCEGSDGGTTFTDESNSAHTITANGAANTDDAQFKFGSTSGFMSSASNETDGLSAADSADWNFGTGDVTIETWWRTTDKTVGQVIFGQVSDANNHQSFVWEPSQGIKCSIISGGAVALNLWSGTPSAISNDTWHHIAYTRSSNTHRFFIDGTLYGGDQSNTSSWADLSGSARIGMDEASIGQTGGVKGWIDEYRITKGVARYTGNFTAPTTAFPRS